jgi:two-component system response regulator HydG
LFSISAALTGTRLAEGWLEEVFMQDETGAILVVDDDRANLESVEKIFAREGYRVSSAVDGPQALALLRKEPVHIMLTDLMMPGMNGVELLKAAKAVAPEVEVILMTAYGTVETAVEAMKEGAYDFVTKPLKRALLVKGVRRALEKQRLSLENRALRAELASVQRPRSIVGTSPAWRRVMDMVSQAAPSTATVLLQGESGTGKELIAKAIHEASLRAKEPFVAFNCAAFPDTLLESELFGYERGAFTGATGRRQGRFETANGGTIFLDEVGEMNPQSQVKLLRVLQEGQFERLGSNQTQSVNVRVVAATNKDLRAEVRAGRFREDLFYRLNVIAIPLPSLRERQEDIPLLIEHFLQVYCAKNNRPLMALSREAMDRLCAYSWPGNVRELENTIERSVVMTRADEIALADLPAPIHDGAGGGRFLTVAIGTPLEEVERRIIAETLRHTRGDKATAAQLLGISVRTIYRKLDLLEPAEEYAAPAPGGRVSP